MKNFACALVVTAFALSLLWVVAFARELGSREARERIAEAVGLDKSDRVHIKDISSGMNGQVIVEATLDAAFRFQQDKQGNWKAVEVRTGDRRWESIELIQTAINKEKVLRTTADLRTLAVALEAFRRERGFYVAADTNSALVDNLAPHYLSPIIRVDAWSREFDYKGTEAGYRLASLGPDGKPNTGDDLIIENGQLIKGATE